MAERKTPRIVNPSTPSSPTVISSIPQHTSPAVLYPLRGEWNSTGKKLISTGRFLSPSQEVFIDHQPPTNLLPLEE